MTTVSKGMERKRPRMGLPTRGPMHLWRTVDPDIPCQVASPQSLTPFLRARPLYHRFRPASKHHWTPSSCLTKSIRTRGQSPPRALQPDEPYFLHWLGTQPGCNGFRTHIEFARSIEDYMMGSSFRPWAECSTVPDFEPITLATLTMAEEEDIQYWVSKHQAVNKSFPKSSRRALANRC